jgi:hypothetical protein
MTDYSFSEVFNPNSDWYCGDFHAHTNASSDGDYPRLHPWDWRFYETDLRYVHCVELWNDLYWPGHVFTNPKTVELWTNWLNAGYRVTAIGGSDYHYPPKPDEGKPGERLGQPTTFVYAEELSAPAILED